MVPCDQDPLDVVGLGVHLAHLWAFGGDPTEAAEAGFGGSQRQGAALDQRGTQRWQVIGTWQFGWYVTILKLYTLMHGILCISKCWTWNFLRIYIWNSAWYPLQPVLAVDPGTGMVGCRQHPSVKLCFNLPAPNLIGGVGRGWPETENR